MPICSLVSESEETQTLFIRAAWPLRSEQLDDFKAELGSYVAERDCRPVKFVLALDFPITTYNLSVLIAGQNKVSGLGAELRLFTDNPQTATTLVRAGFFETFQIYTLLTHVLEANPTLPREPIVRTYSRMKHMTL